MHTTGITIPALYARITREGHVTCTATLRPLGDVAWAQRPQNVVVWIFVVADSTETGERSTQRAAVQALRDAANKRARVPLPTGPDDERPIAERAAARIKRARASHDDEQHDEQRSTTSTQRAPLPAQRIAWGSSATDVADLTSAIQRAFDRHK